jgi:hypothetical protein
MQNLLKKIYIKINPNGMWVNFFSLINRAHTTMMIGIDSPYITIHH